MCLEFRQVGCRDWEDKHATRHYRDMGHPIMGAIEPGERWLWCYLDEAADL